MKIKNSICLVLLYWLGLSAYAQKMLPQSLPVRFASQAEAKELLADDDAFSEGLNQFDLNLRLEKCNARKSEWTQLVQNEALAWTEDEKEKINKAFQLIRENIHQLDMQIPCPDEIVLIKTSMNEELKAGGYTRKNWIAIGEREVQRAPQAFLNELVGHELFHVLSRHNPTFKARIYNTIGFSMVGREIRFPSDLMNCRISNPDIARRDSYITLNIDGENKKCAECIYTQRPYTEGGIMDYLTVGFIPLDSNYAPISKEGKTIVYPLKKVVQQLKEKVGNNTNYIIDPEEICADNFSYLVTRKQNLPSPEITTAMQRCLQMPFNKK